MFCSRCRQEIGTTEQSFTDNRSGVVWCHPCLSIVHAVRDDDYEDPLREALLEKWEETEERESLPAPLDDGIQVEGCEMIWYQLQSGQRLAVWISGNTLIVGHDLVDMPVTAHGRTPDGDMIIVPGKPLKGATIDYQRPGVPSPN